MALVRGSREADAYRRKKKKKKDDGVLHPVGLGASGGVGPPTPASGVTSQQLTEGQARGLETLTVPGMPGYEDYRDDEGKPITMYALERPELTVSQQMKVLDDAYLELNERHMDPGFMARMLMMTGPRITKDEAKKLLGFDRKQPDWFQPGEPEAAALTPTIAEASGHPQGFSEDEGIRERLALSGGDKPLFGVNDDGMPDYQPFLKKIRGPEYENFIAGLPDTPYGEQMRDAMTEDVLYVKGQLAQRAEEAGAHLEGWTGIDFDRNSPEWDYNTDRAFRQYAFYSLLPYYLRGTDAQRDMAREQLLGKADSEGQQTPGLIYDLYGNDAQKIGAELDHLQATFDELEMRPQMKAFLYDAWMQGRPFGQTELKRRYDYLSNFGKTMLPDDVLKQIEGEQVTVGRVIFAPFEFAGGVFSGIEEEHNRLHAEGVRGGALGGGLQSSQRGRGYRPQTEGEKGGIHGSLFGNFMDAVNGVQNAASLVIDAPSLAFTKGEQAASSLVTMAGLAWGTHVVDENGDIVVNPEILKGGFRPDMLDPDAILSARNWAEAWERGEGKMVVRSYADNLALMAGKDPGELDGAQWQLLNAAVAGADLWAAIWVGGKVDKGMRWGVKKGAVKGWEGARYSWQKGADLWAAERARRPGFYGQPEAGILGEAPGGRGYHGTRAELTAIDPSKALSSVGVFDVTDTFKSGQFYAETGRGGQPKVYEVSGKPQKPFRFEEAAERGVWEQVSDAIELTPEQRADVLDAPTNREAYRRATSYTSSGEQATAIKRVIEDDLGYDAYVFTEQGWAGGPETHTVTSWTKRAVEEGRVKIVGQAKGIGHAGSASVDFMTFGLAEPVAKFIERVRSGKEKGKAAKEAQALADERARIMGNNEYSTFDARDSNFGYKDMTKKKGARGNTVTNNALTGTTSSSAPTPMGSGAARRRERMGGTKEGAEQLAKAREAKQLIDADKSITNAELDRIVNDLGLPQHQSWEPFVDVPLEKKRADVAELVDAEIQRVTDTHPDYAMARIEEIDGRLAELAGIETDASGVKTLAIEGVGAVDASIADSVRALNEKGYETVSSHGFAEDHPADHPTVKEGVAPYIEFRKGRLPKGALADIRKAAEKHGLEVEEGKFQTGKDKFAPTVLVRGEGLREFTRELTGERVAEPPLAEDAAGQVSIVEEGRQTDMGFEGGERAPAEAPPEGPPPEMPGQMGFEEPAGPREPTEYPYRKVPGILKSKAEVLAELTTEIGRDESLVADLLGLADDMRAKGEVVPKVEEIVLTRDPQRVAELMWSLTAHDPSLVVDPLGPGLLYYLKASSEIRAGTRGTLPDFLRAATTYTAFDREIPLRNTHRDLMNFAIAVKMGKKQPGARDFALAREYATEIWRTPDPTKRKRIYDRFDALVRKNMEAEGTWDGYIKFRNKVRSLRGELRFGSELSASGVQRRAYDPFGNADRVITKRDFHDFWERRENLKERLESEAMTPYDRERLAKAFRDADAAVKKMRADARLWNRAMRGKVSFDDPKVKAAGERIDSWASPEPVYSFQLRKTMRHHTDIDPRTLSAFMAGHTNRAFTIANAYTDPLMRVWKAMVMSTLGFPVRVNVGDEFWRLIPEGVAPGTRAFKEAHATAKELFGGKSLILRRQRALTRGERGEVKRLREKEKPTKEEQDRLAELEAKAEGTAERQISDRLFDRAFTDYAEYMGDDWVLAGPKDNVPNYHRSMQDFLHQLASEDFIEAWVKEGMPELPRAELEAFVREATLNSERGQKLLDQTGRAWTDKNGSRHVSKPGVDALVRSYADIVERIAGDRYLKEAMRTKRISLKTLSQVPNEHLWEIPVKTGLYKPWGGKLNILTPSGFYERITLPMMSAMNGRIRETLFSDRFLRESRRLREENPSMPREELIDIASERALDYTNTVSFTRRPTIMEDALRNAIPFISSYRQFAIYWLRTFGKHPFAMTAAYKANPLQGATFAQVGDYSAPVGWLMPFWMQQDFREPETGPVGVAKQSVPNLNPFAAWLASRVWGLKSESDLSELPGFDSANPNFAPLSRFGNLWFAYMGTQFPLSRPVESMKKLHYDILRSNVSARTPAYGPTEAQYDMPVWYDVLKAVGFKYPEVAFSEATKTAGLTSSYTPEQARMVRDGQAEMAKRDKAGQAKYRAENPWFDDWMKVTQDGLAMPEMRKVVAKRPELVAWIPGTYDSTINGKETTYAYDDFLALVERGTVNVKSDERHAEDYVRTYVKFFGGRFEDYDGGPSIFYPGDIAHAKADKTLKTALKRAKGLAKRAAREMAAGDKDAYENLMGLWERTVEHKRGDKYVLHARFAEWAEKNGYAEQELNPGALEEMHEITKGYGYGPKFAPAEPGDDDYRLFNGLADEGLISRSHARNLLGPRYRDNAAAEALDFDVRNRKALLGTKEEETFKLDSNDLRLMGYDAGPAFDRAQADVSAFYYKEGGYKWCKDTYGPTASETRKARNAYYAYRDRRMARVKGGEAVRGGLTETLANDPYFTEVQGSFSGKNAENDQKLWNEYLKEARKPKPSMKRINFLKTHFDKKLKDRWEERQRVNDWVYIVAKAKDYRYVMRHSYSEFYQGEGNSTYSTAGKKLVAELEALIRKMYRDDAGEDSSTSLLAKDVKLYFGDAHGLAYNMLNWYWH
jgi:hypothetical protein